MPFRAANSFARRSRWFFITLLDDARFRAFDTMEDYRRWCEENLPDWLGYGRG